MFCKHEIGPNFQTRSAEIMPYTRLSFFLLRYQIAKVYRRDNPAMTKGRFREFFQCVMPDLASLIWPS